MFGPQRKFQRKNMFVTFNFNYYFLPNKFFMPENKLFV